MLFHQEQSTEGINPDPPHKFLSHLHSQGKEVGSIHFPAFRQRQEGQISILYLVGGKGESSCPCPSCAKVGDGRIGKTSWKEVACLRAFSACRNRIPDWMIYKHCKLILLTDLQAGKARSVALTSGEGLPAALPQSQGNMGRGLNSRYNNLPLIIPGPW